MQTGDSARKVASKQKYRAPALEKGLAILELLAVQKRPLVLKDISRLLGRSSSEIFRMMQVLVDCGYIVSADDSEGYLLSNKLFALGMAQPPTSTLNELALPVMRQLSISTGQSCHLVVVSGDQIVIISRVEKPGDLGFSVRVGYRRELHHSTSGAVLVAFMSEADREGWLAALRHSAKPTEVKDFVSRVAIAQKRGYTTRESEYVSGVTDIAAPILRQGHIAAALTIPFVRYSPPTCSLQDATKLLLDATRHLSRLVSEEGS